jgi:hypothetical protein
MDHDRGRPRKTFEQRFGELAGPMMRALRRR